MDTEPHSPHEEVVLPVRAAGTGARPPVETETTLNSVETALPVPQ